MDTFEDDIERRLLGGMTLSNNSTQPSYLRSTSDNASAALTESMVEKDLLGARSFSSEDFRYSHTFKKVMEKKKRSKERSSEAPADEESKDHML